jgi:endonuclease/exonuclease/phosphatase family metal-dependent hydrolase
MGKATYSKKPLTNLGYKLLGTGSGHLPAWYNRNVLRSAVSLDDGTTIVMYNVHLEFRGPDELGIEIRNLEKLLNNDFDKANGNINQIVIGDFNNEPDTVIRKFRPDTNYVHLNSPCSGERQSRPGIQAFGTGFTAGDSHHGTIGRTIDMAFYRFATAGLTITGSCVLTKGSDHLPIVVDIK